MKRAGRIIYNLATAVSLLLCPTTMGVWVRGQWYADSLYYRSDGLLISLDSRNGEIAVVVQHRNSFHPHGYEYRQLREPRWSVRYSLYPAWDKSEWQTLGFSVFIAPSREHWVITVPCWAIVGACGAWPMVRLLWRLRRQSRLDRDAAAVACAGCGYDLRVTSDRCPECGTLSAKGAS